MKITNHILDLFRALVFAAAVVMFASCQTDLIKMETGKLPNIDDITAVNGFLRSVKSPHNRASVRLTQGVNTAKEKIYYKLTLPALADMTLTAKVDVSLVDGYNKEYGTTLAAFPEASVQIAGNGVLTLKRGERASENIEVTFSSDGIAPGTYLLPIAIETNSSELNKNDILYFGVAIREIDVIPYELDTEFTTVLYLNTSDYQPLLADVLLLEKIDGMSFETLWKRTYGNIVNLRVVQIGYDQPSARAKLVLNTDIRYVLDHADKYIRPLQDKGRKVCLSIEGSGKGIGFCNMNDTQIADFTTQVKAVVELYGLDGINLFDRNSGYGKEGMPEVNTTSYPKLIKAMREALGSGKMLTIADYEAPTEYFWDTNATGGISVGDYLDYAWSGYMSENEDVQLVDPWLDQQTADDNMIVLRARKPIAGLREDQFGCFAVPFYASDSEYLINAEGFINIYQWTTALPRRNNILVFGDLISNHQGRYEASWSTVPSCIWMTFPDGAMDGVYNFNMYVNTPIYGLEYDQYGKDW